MVEGTVLGHETVGIVREVGPGVRNLRPVTGSSSLRPSAAAPAPTARAGYYAQCDRANPNGPHARTCFFGGP
jgi:threonine dehydrogenase-like Zn-dependent dehydrogenase